jgi:DNA polymerase-1
MDYLGVCFDEGLVGNRIGFDIELYNEELACVGLGYVATEAMCINFINGQGDRFDINQEDAIMREIARLLSHNGIRKVGQNLAFDSNFMLSRYGIPVHSIDDTMIAQRILMPDYPIGLDFITSIWTDMPYYKGEGKRFYKGVGGWDTFWTYNCNDVMACLEAFPKQLRSIEQQGNLSTYRRTRKVVEPLVFMMANGIKIDVEALCEEYDVEGEVVECLRSQLCKLAGHELNANSPKQLSQYFYQEKGEKPYVFKGKETTDELAMKRLSRKGYKEAKLVLDIRGTVKNRSTYLNPEKVDKDGRMRCSYNPVGTKFSRLSSSENIFGTGNNLQNQPHEVLKFFVADTDYIIYSIDLSQAENRIVAYVGQIEPMIEAFETNKDVHSLTGSLISGKSYDLIIKEDKENVYCPLGGGDKTWRFWGKKANHGLNYDLGYKTFALYYEISERDAKIIVERYHTVYPGVRQGFHKVVRDQLSLNRTVTNLMGRKTLFMGEWGESLFKEAYSCIPQGTVGDIINERGINYIYYNQHIFKPVKLIMQVHDSIAFQIPLFCSWTEHAEMLLSIRESLETPLKVHGREFIIPADLSIGFNLYKKEMKELKGSKFPNTVEELSANLETIHKELSNDRQKSE